MAGKTRVGQFLKSKGSSQKEAAELLGISTSTFSQKANGFNESEICKMAEHYGMTDDEIAKVFK